MHPAQRRRRLWAAACPPSRRSASTRRGTRMILQGTRRPALGSCPPSGLRDCCATPRESSDGRVETRRAVAWPGAARQGRAPRARHRCPLRVLRGRRGRGGPAAPGDRRGRARGPLRGARLWAGAPRVRRWAATARGGSAGRLEGVAGDGPGTAGDCRGRPGGLRLRARGLRFSVSPCLRVSVSPCLCVVAALAGCCVLSKRALCSRLILDSVRMRSSSSFSSPSLSSCHRHRHRHRFHHHHHMPRSAGQESRRRWALNSYNETVDDTTAVAVDLRLSTA